MKLMLSYIILKLHPKTKKNSTLKSQREKKRHVTFIGEEIKLMEFLRETVEARRKGNYIFKLL